MPSHSAAGRPRVYLHLGMPKTGTTSIQRTLAANSSSLASQGYVYPKRWRASRHHHAHHELVNLVRAPGRAPAIAADVRRFLCRNRDRNVILSAEGLSHALVSERGREALTMLLDHCSEVAEPAAIVVLRRLDDYLASAFLQVTKLAHHNVAVAPEEFVQARGRSWELLFAGLRWLREQAGVEVTLIPYLDREDVLPTILGAMGIEDGSAFTTEQSTAVNRRLGLKAQAVLMLPDAALLRLGVDPRRARPGAQRASLVELFESGAFSFRGEIYDYDLLGHELRREIHARALEQARRNGIDEYVNAFADATLPQTTATRLDTSLISAGDLLELAEAIEARKSVAV